MNLPRYQKIFRLCIVGRGSFSSISPCDYPYKFGGIAQKQQTQHPKNFVNHLFGQEVKEGFRIAYISVLEALKNKDKDLLTNIMQPTLTKKLKFLDVQFVNSQAPLEVRIHKSKMTLGGQFIRNDKNRTVSQYSNTSLAGFEGYMCEQGLQSGMMNGMKIPILFSFDIYFKGITKLLKSNKQNADKQQYHMLQFQLENTISFQQLIASVGEMQESKNNAQGFRKVTKKLIGNNYQWKIADMDVSLQGNMIIKKGGFGGFGGFGNLGGFLKK